jgi:hypothetical protein
MKYINTQTLEYPFTELQIKVLPQFDNCAFGDPFVPPPPFEKVVDTEPPTYDPVTQLLVEVTPVADASGVWSQQWSVQARPLADVQAAVSNDIVDKVQQRLDDFARTRDYDGIASLAGYAGDDDPVFNVEGTYGKKMRSQTWRKVYQIQSDANAGNWPTAGAGQMPMSYADIESSLPALAWPNQVGQTT